MNNSFRLIASLMLLLCTFCVMPKVQAQNELPSVMEKNGDYLFTALKMSPADQASLLKLLGKEKESAYSLGVNTAKSDKSYGRLSGVNMKVKEIAGGKITTQASATCHSVSTDNNCYTINTIVSLKALGSKTQAQVKALVSKYIR